MLFSAQDIALNSKILLRNENKTRISYTENEEFRSLRSTTQFEAARTVEESRKTGSQKKDYLIYGVLANHPYIFYSENDVIDLAKLLFAECYSVDSTTEQACVAWCVLNRADYHHKSIYSVLREPDQFAFYEQSPVYDDMYELAEDVLFRWSLEKLGYSDPKRVLPREYMYFSGNGVRNIFRTKYTGDFDVWDFSAESPYKN